VRAKLFHISDRQRSRPVRAQSVAVLPIEATRGAFVGDAPPPFRLSRCLPTGAPLRRFGFQTQRNTPSISRKAFAGRGAGIYRFARWPSGWRPWAFTVETISWRSPMLRVYTSPAKLLATSADHTNVSLPHTAARSLKSSCGLVDGRFRASGATGRRIQTHRVGSPISASSRAIGPFVATGKRASYA